MQPCPKQSQGLIEFRGVSAPVVSPAKVNATSEQATNMAGRGGYSKILRGNVILEPGSLVDAQFAPLVDRTSESGIVLASVQVVGIVLWIVNVILWSARIIVSEPSSLEEHDSLTCSIPIALP